MTTTTLAKDRFNHAVQALQPGPSQNVATAAGASAQSTAIGGNTVVVRLVATSATYIAMGVNPTATSSSAYLPAGMVEYFRVTPASAWKIAGLAVSTSGTLNVVEMT